MKINCRISLLQPQVIGRGRLHDLVSPNKVLMNNALTHLNGSRCTNHVNYEMAVRSDISSLTFNIGTKYIFLV